MIKDSIRLEGVTSNSKSVGVFWDISIDKEAIDTTHKSFSRFSKYEQKRANIVRRFYHISLFPSN